MLVLTRRVGDSVTIFLPGGQQCVVSVHKVKRGAMQLRLGFEAPKEVEIVRSELLEGTTDEGL